MRADRRPAAMLACVLALFAPTGPAHAALCGDTSGNGFLTVTDALATLTLAVRGGYDRRGDVAPQNGNGTITAADALVTLRHVVGDSFPFCRGAGASRAVATTATYDFSSGGFAVIDLDSDDLTKRTIATRSGSVSRDAVVGTTAGSAIVINRLGYDSLQVLDIDDAKLPTVKECSVSGGFESNPQDVVLLSADKGYVTAYEGSSLFVIRPEILFDPKVDPACNGMIQGSVDLSSFDSGDGVPEMDQMALVGTRLFVSLQRLDGGREPTQGTGRLVVIDTATDEVETSIPLSFTNPFAATKGLPYDEFQNRLFVGGPGRIGNDLDDGGIEAIDPLSLQSAGMLLTGADLGANIFDFVIVGTDRAFAIVASKDSNSVEWNSVVDIDLVHRRVRDGGVLLTSTAMITDIEMTERGELWVAYRGEDKADPPGIRIFRVTRENPELTASPIRLGQPPFTIAFLP